MAQRLGWAPETFWRSTLSEFFPMIEQWNEDHGVKRSEAPSRERLDELKRKYG